MPTIQQTRFTSACPPVDEYHFHAYSGGGIQVMALALLDGRITVDDELAKVVSACTTCGACDVSCKFIMAAERQDVIIALKEHIAEAGLGVTPKIENIKKLWEGTEYDKPFVGSYGIHFVTLSFGCFTFQYYKRENINRPNNLMTVLFVKTFEFFFNSAQGLVNPLGKIP